MVYCKTDESMRMEGASVYADCPFLKEAVLTFTEEGKNL